LDEDIIKMQMSSILAKNPDVKIYPISSSAHQGLDELLFALKSEIENSKKNIEAPVENLEPTNFDEDGIAHISLDSPESFENSPVINMNSLPVIKLNPKNIKNTWAVEELEPFDDGTKFFRVTGEKIEKFARRTDYDNYESLNRLRDIMKKYGIRAELTSRGAEAESIIEIAGHRFTLVEGWGDDEN
jgi:GTP-binding protein